MMRAEEVASACRRCRARWFSTRYGISCPPSAHHPDAALVAGPAAPRLAQALEGKRLPDLPEVQVLVPLAIEDEAAAPLLRSLEGDDTLLPGHDLIAVARSNSCVWSSVRSVSREAGRDFQRGRLLRASRHVGLGPRQFLGHRPIGEAVVLAAAGLCEDADPRAGRLGTADTIVSRFGTSFVARSRRGPDRGTPPCRRSRAASAPHTPRGFLRKVRHASAQVPMPSRGWGGTRDTSRGSWPPSTTIGNTTRNTAATTFSG